jgi:hypothetical protein
MTRAPALLAVTAAALFTGSLFFATAQAGNDDADDQAAERAERDAERIRERAERDAERAERNAERARERAQRDAERAQRDAERAQRNAERAHQNGARISGDAQRFARDQARGAIAQARDQIKTAIQSIANDKSIPGPLRASLLTRLRKTQQIMDQRLGRIGSSGDWSTFEAEMESMGQEIESTFEGLDDEMEKFGKDMEAWGEKFGQKFEKEFGETFEKELEEKLRNGIFVGPHGVPAPPAPPAPPGPYAPPAPPAPPALPSSRHAIDMSDLDTSIDLGDLSLTPAQRQALERIVADEAKVVGSAEGSLETLTDRLRSKLADPNSDEGDIARTVDAITAEEGKIRKARILAWAKARKVLDDRQRGKVQRARHR